MVVKVPTEVEVTVSLCREYVERELCGAATIPWDGVTSFAYAHGLIGVVSRSLRCGEAPEASVRELQVLAVAQAALSLQLTAETVRVVQYLEVHGVPALVLKGSALAAIAYGQFSDRYFEDIDILVNPRDLAEAVAIFKDLGYSECPGEHRARKDKHVRFEREHITVELHWALNERWRRAPIEAGIWDRARSVNVAGSSIRTLSVEDALLFLCVHGARHSWSRLKWVLDLSCLITYSSVDWPSLRQRARDAGCLRMLRVGLLLAARVFGTNVPSDIRRDAEDDHMACRLSAQFWHSICGGEIGPKATIASQLQIRERLRDRSCLLASMLGRRWRPTAADEPGMHLPGWVSGIRYFVRPVRLMRTYGLGWMKAVFRY